MGMDARVSNSYCYNYEYVWHMLMPITRPSLATKLRLAHAITGRLAKQRLLIQVSLFFHIDSELTILHCILKMGLEQEVYNHSLVCSHLTLSI